MKRDPVPFTFTPREFDKRAMGKRIKMRMLELDYTQQNIADALEINIANIFNWANGYAAPSARHLIELARLLETTAEWLVFGDEH